MKQISIENQSIFLPSFDSGGEYPIEAELLNDADSMLAQLPAFPKTVKVDRDGGLLNHLSVWQNLCLPLQYHALDTNHLKEDAALIFILCGVDKANLPRLMENYPDDLSLYEKRLVGFVRALLIEPSFLVLDNIFEGLSTLEKVQVSRWENVFKIRFPFRVLLYCGQNI
jgi:ABC-type uncharacterized transport system YnjBCD ATPase subunit